MTAFVYYINTNEIPNHCKRRDLSYNHSSGDLFTCKDNMLFLRVKICFRAKAHLIKRISQVTAPLKYVQGS